ncbi:hypothetical protein BH10PLA1_BH10PLA1_11930 [soil metagenome]
MTESIVTITELPPHDTPSRRVAVIKAAITVALAAVMVVLIAGHVHYVNGPWYWTWHWRKLPGWPLYPLMAAAAIPFVLAQLIHDRHRKSAIALLMLGILSMELAAISQQPLGLGRIAEVTGNSVNMSYFPAAKILVQEEAKGVPRSIWMEAFPDLLNQFQYHAKFKPPGLILIFMGLIKLVGAAKAPMIGGVLIGVLATVTAPATYGLVRYFTRDGLIAWCAASFMAMCPSLILFMPQFDQIFPAVACGLIGLWFLALRTGRAHYAIAFGLSLAASVFVTYTFLMLGIFLAVSTILFIGDNPRIHGERVIRQAIIAVACIALFYFALYFSWNFNAWATYEAIAVMAERDFIMLQRTMPLNLPFDFMDVVMGTGYVSLPLAVMAVVHVRKLPRGNPSRRWVFLALTQVLMAIGVCMLPGEEARLFLLFMPLIAGVAGIELARWPAKFRGAVFIAMWVVTVALAQNMLFLNQGDIDKPTRTDLPVVTVISK